MGRTLLSKLKPQNLSTSFRFAPGRFGGQPLLQAFKFEAVKKFVIQFSRRWGMAVDCQIAQQPVTISPEVERSLYRILQETLSNARQHANCDRLTVELTITGQQWLTLKVEDDGRGFDVKQRLNFDRFDRNEQQGRGLGLVPMRGRTERLGGELWVNSIEGQGTCILGDVKK